MGHYVYLHRRLDDGLPFYVGKGHNRRAYVKDGRSSWWNKVVAKHGYSIEILQWFDDEKEAFQYEIDGIAALKEAGYLLVNLTLGGDNFGGYKLTPEQRAKVGRANSIKLKGRTPTVRITDGNLKYKIIATDFFGVSKILIGALDIKAAGFQPACVYACCRGYNKTHRGHTFKKELL